MKKVIAICATRIQDEYRINYTEKLSRLVNAQEYSVAVFHSVFDFSGANVETGARVIYKMLPWERLCAVVVLRDSIFDPSVLDDIIRGAEKHKVPVIMARGFDERCYSLTADFRGAYRELLNSVIKEQGIKDAFYIAGRQTEDPDGEQRLAVYSEVLEENGYALDMSKVDYGGYWENPTIEAMNRLFERRADNMPDAIFCANDIMAYTVIEMLNKRGFRVPEDVVVTGFDGLESSKYSTPTLSTCCEDTAALVELTVSTVERLCSGQEPPRVQNYPFRAAIRQSSERHRKVKPAELDTNLYFLMRADEINEREFNRWLDGIIAIPNIVNLRSNIPAMAIDGYSVCIRADAFLNDEMNNAADSPREYVMIRRSETGELSEKFALAEKVIPRFLDSTPEGVIGYYSMVSNHGFVYGLCYTPCKDIRSDSVKINRYINTINRALFVALSGEKQRKTLGEHYKRKYIDALTGMLNMDGANKWFSDNVLNDYTHTNNLSVGVYSFINYQQVLENYGTHTLEDAMQLVGKALKLSNPDYAVIARISVDSFAVMLLHPYNETYAFVIDNAISLFYGYLDTQKKADPKTSGIEISCGYTDSMNPWDSKLSDFINAATSNLYRNRMTFEKNKPASVDMNDNTKLMEHRASFMTLINENLFVYHFQPIVDAKTGNIVAYEALMRTKGGIKMNPLDIIAAASMYNKLEQLEYMTFVNIYEQLSANLDKFKGKHVFINTIPGHFVRPEICAMLCDRFPELIKRSVIEITESETITLSELESIRSFGGTTNILNIAVDDYGTGHSNIVNLIEYQPQIVKIDRYLISNIQNDKNKQMFVKSLIEFSEENHIKVLAEGVETVEELRTVIEFGVDLIQGYYTARPAEELITELPENIRQEILEAQRGVSVDS